VETGAGAEHAVDDRSVVRHAAVLDEPLFRCGDVERAVGHGADSGALVDGAAGREGIRRQAHRVKPVRFPRSNAARITSSRYLAAISRRASSIRARSSNVAIRNRGHSLLRDA
jgi:hypothetical protein